MIVWLVWFIMREGVGYSYLEVISLVETNFNWNHNYQSNISFLNNMDQDKKNCTKGSLFISFRNINNPILEISVPTLFPEWNSLPFPDLMAYIPYQFYMKLCEIFLLTKNMSKYWIQEDILFNNLVQSVVNYPPFCFWIELYFSHIRKHEIPYIFLTFWPISQPFLTLLANSLPFQGIKKIKSDSWLFQDFPSPWEPWEM